MSEEPLNCKATDMYVAARSVLHHSDTCEQGSFNKEEASWSNASVEQLLLM